MQTLLPKKKYNNIKKIALYSLIFACFYCFSFAGIKEQVYPFSIGFFITLIWCNKNNFLISAFFCLTSFLWKFNFNYFLCSVVFSVLVNLTLLIFKRKNNHLPCLLYTIFCSVYLFVFLPYHLFYKTPFINIFYTFLLAIIFYLSLNKCFKTLLTKKTNIALNLDEIVCACFVLITLGCGLAEITIFNIPLIKPVGIFLIFLSSMVSYSNSPLIIGACLGVGYTLNLSNLNYVAILSCFALISIIFKNNKYYCSLSLIITELILSLYFNVYNTYSFVLFLSALVPIIFVVIIRKNHLVTLKTFLATNINNLSSRSIIERNKQTLSKQFLEMSNAFFEINIGLKNSLKDKLPKQEAIGVIRQELCKKICYNCKNKDRCLTLLKEPIFTAFDTIIDTGFQKQKISVLDIPPILATNCEKLSLLTNTTNNLLQTYNTFTTSLEEKNYGKLLMCEEIEALHKMFLNLSKNIQTNCTYDFEKEQQIIENLNYVNILVKDVVLFLSSGEVLELSLLVQDGDLENENFIKTINNTLNCKMEIVSISKSCYNKFNSVILKKCSKYNCIYGIGGACKHLNTISGDNFSCVKLSKNRVLFAICDGMGNGEQAKLHSEHTIGLIENFYKAGFNDENVIEIVNRLISLDSEDFFSALDLAIINLDTGKTDFIKVGSQESFIKDCQDVQIISGNSLPMGIVKDITPTYISRIVTTSDMVLMCSDGAIDCIGLDELKIFIKQSTIKNPQTICDEIVNLALKEANGKPKDDITVMAFKLFLN